MPRRTVLSLCALVAVSVCISTSRDAAALVAPLYTGPEQITSVNGGGCLDAPLPQPTSGQWLLQQFPCNAGQNQFWSFAPVGQDASSRNIVEIHSQLDAGFCLDLPNGSVASNTKVQLFRCHHGPDQQWVLNPVDTQTVRVMPVGDTSMCLDVVNAVANARAQIQLFPCKPSTDPGRTNQEWRPASLPQGLTGGVAYVNHDCGVNLGAFAKLVASGASSVGVVNCSEDLGCLGAGVTPAAALISAATGSSFVTCGAPSVFRSGSVVVAGAPTATLKLERDKSSFTSQAAPGWLTQSDGDIGNSANFGFYHQELTAAGGGVTDGSVSDKFKLPRGTACGFHHTRNTPFVKTAGPQSTCMGQDPAKKQCPKGWILKSHFDMSSGDGGATCANLDSSQDHCAFFTWCEYQDPNRVCDNDPQCLAMARANGYAVGISSNVDPNGVETGGAGNPSCPIGFSRVHFHDDGRSAGQGLSWCIPIGDLPQGLTAGMAYTDCDVPLLCSGRHVVAGGKALGATTPFEEGDGFQVRLDGDIGAHGDRGFNHQELVSGGMRDMSQSDRFKLLPGTACGFHHTKVTPRLTCMGMDPAKEGCPAGWIVRSQFDMSSGDGSKPCGNLQNQDHCGYFVWCEYQDPHRLCAPPNRTDCQDEAERIGYNVGIGSNVESSGSPVADGGTCPAGWTMSPNLDAGRSSEQGVRWCIPKAN